MKKRYDGNILNPLPVALIGANVAGRPNYLVIAYCAPFDFGKKVFFSLFKKRYTAEGILENRTFSVNIPSVDLMEQVELCGSKSGRDTDKATLFDTFYGELRTAPMIGECPLNMECEVSELIETEQNYGVVGRVAASYVNGDLLKDEEHIDLRRANLFVWLTCGDYHYYRLGERIARPGDSQYDG